MAALLPQLAQSGADGLPQLRYGSDLTDQEWEIIAPFTQPAQDKPAAQVDAARYRQHDLLLYYGRLRPEPASQRFPAARRSPELVRRYRPSPS
jgi:hypothetical protein